MMWQRRSMLDDLLLEFEWLAPESIPASASVRLTTMQA